MTGLLALVFVPLVLSAAAPVAAPRPVADHAAASTRTLQAALARLSQTLKEKPDNLDALNRLALVQAQLGRSAAAQALYRRAIAVAPDAWLAYARLADLLAVDPRRWEQRGELLALLKAGLLRTAGDAEGHLRLSLSAANFERAVGQTQAARARLQALQTDALSASLRKQVLDLLEDIQSDEQQGALRDWPEPPVAPSLAEQQTRLEQALKDGDAQTALRGSEALVRISPSWRAPRWLRARALEALGRFDDAERELTILLQLGPSHAAAWRQLGILLAAHGGALDAERCDAALRHALALEPAYFDLWLLRAQVSLRSGALAPARRALQRYLREVSEQAPQRREDPQVRSLLAAVHAPPEAAQRLAPAPRSATAPSARAQELYHQAKDWLQSGDPVGLAPDLLAEALLDSPGYVDAAATAYALTGQVPPATVAALWQDGEALLALARQLRAISSSVETARLLRPWLDHAVALGDAAAYFERGVLLIDDNHPAEAIADLRSYVASAAAPAALEEARLLLAALDRGGAQEAALMRARSLLLAEKPVEAAAALGGSCTGTGTDLAGQDQTDPAMLLMLGVVQEWAGELPAAVACYRRALRRGERAAPLQRLAQVAARAPLPLLTQLQPELQQAAAQGVASAHFALARLLLSRGETEAALVGLDSFLRDAPPQDPSRTAALSARGQITAERERRQHEIRARRTLFGAAALTLLGAALLWLLRGRSLARALTRRPALFPEVARTIGQLRHDVLKHRTSALGLVAQGASVHAEVRGMLWEPERASSLIAAAYARLQTAARAHGVLLRPLHREPIFGPLWGDLRRAETLLKAARLSPAALSALQRVDERLREQHSERLGALLRLGPRTRVDAALLTTWIRDVEAELRLRRQPWTSPVLLLEELELEFPVERLALMTLFANLLRNAQAAVASEAAMSGAASVLVRVGEERDATGRRLLVLLVGDSARGELTLEMVERRETGRGLAILRDLLHQWRGHLVIRSENAPWTKGVGACFPT